MAFADQTETSAAPSVCVGVGRVGADDWGDMLGGDGGVPGSNFFSCTEVMASGPSVTSGSRSAW